MSATTTALRMFVPAVVDDAGLSPNAFRIYGRICRRWSERQGCNEAKVNMARACGMGKTACFDALNELEERGMILRSGSGKASRIDLVPPSGWRRASTGQALQPSPLANRSGASVSPLANRSTVSAGEPLGPTVSAGEHQPSQLANTQLFASGDTKGIPLKGIPEGMQYKSPPTYEGGAPDSSGGDGQSQDHDELPGFRAVRPVDEPAPVVDVAPGPPVQTQTDDERRAAIAAALPGWVPSEDGPGTPTAAALRARADTGTDRAIERLPADERAELDAEAARRAEQAWPGTWPGAGDPAVRTVVARLRREIHNTQTPS